MLDGRHLETGSAGPGSSAVILQIDPPGGGSPLKFPAVVRNLAIGVVTLEVNNPWIILNWNTLKGQGGCLRVPSGSEEFADLRGTVTWARYYVQGQDSGHLRLGMVLGAPDQTARRLLVRHISHTAEDIKGLWERWDLARPTPGPEAFSAKIGFAALALLFAGVSLQMAEPKGYKLVGWVLWFFGTLVVGGQTLRFWRSRNASR